MLILDTPFLLSSCVVVFLEDLDMQDFVTNLFVSYIFSQAKVKEINGDAGSGKNDDTSFYPMIGAVAFLEDVDAREKKKHRKKIEAKEREEGFRLSVLRWMQSPAVF